MRVAYFVQDLNDRVVHRRVRMLQATGVSVALLGFCRGEPPRVVEGVIPVMLGRTEESRLVQRAGAVIGGLLALPRTRASLAGVSMIVARNLEMLAIAAAARRVYARSTPLVFECLDIHRLMSQPGRVGDAIRAIEGRLLPRCQALVVSAPTFLDQHFARFGPRLPPAILIENKVLAFELDDGCEPDRSGAPSRPPGKPWRIGWYGVIRCARSLDMLTRLVSSHPGDIEVVIRGRIAPNVFPDFDAVVAACPGLVFDGPYDRQHDLKRIYGDVHFAWAIDFYEDGGNSDWLLASRIYEAPLFGAVPIARREVASGEWLARRGIGALLAGPPDRALDAFFQALDADAYAGLADAVARRPETDFLYTLADCQDLVRTLVETAGVGSDASHEGLSKAPSRWRAVAARSKPSP
jgi:succinoglycan biosynthesis protein ExoL